MNKYTKGDEVKDNGYALVVFVSIIVAMWLSSCSISKTGIDIGYEAIKLRNQAIHLDNLKSQQIRNTNWEVK